jgi:hypothetical protein
VHQYFIPYAAFEVLAAAGLSISFGIRDCDMLMDGCRPTLLQQMAIFSLFGRGNTKLEGFGNRNFTFSNRLRWQVLKVDM